MAGFGSGFNFGFFSGGIAPEPATYTEYFVSDGIGGFEQAYDSAAADQMSRPWLKFLSP